MGGTGSGQHGGRPDRGRAAAASTSTGCTGKVACDRDGSARSTGRATGEGVGSIGMRAIEGRITLTYRYRCNDEEWQAVEEPVSIVWTPCHFGGSRPWFVCPGVVNGVPCGRRVGKLYGPGRYFLCRHCYGLAYQSQREQAHERALRRAVAIRRRLGGEPGMLCPFPEKPKGMQWRTYERLRQRVRRRRRWWRTSTCGVAGSHSST